jgi:hypothetical protein
MEQIRSTMVEGEPMGIVISGGFAEEPAPRFSAYVWSDAPEAEETPAIRRAA